MEGSRVLQGESMEVFKEGIRVVINFWWVIRRFVIEERDDSDIWLKLDQLYDNLFSWFIQSKDPPCIPSAKIALQKQISFFPRHLSSLDNSIEEVAEQLVSMYEECLQSNFSSVNIIKQANLSGVRRQMRKHMNKSKMKNPSIEIINEISQPHHLNKKRKRLDMEANLSRAQEQANSSEKDDSSVQQVESLGVFREGIGLFIENLWARHVFVEELCGSNPQLMLEELADDILFWFTQTIKPLSFAYIERIIRNEMYCLPVDVEVVTNGITKEVAEKLLSMHGECLQGNFRSVEMLREECESAQSRVMKQGKSAKADKFSGVDGGGDDKCR